MSNIISALKTENYKKDTLLNVSEMLIYLVITICFVPSVMMIVLSLVHDRELKLREGMAMMGMDFKAYYASLFVHRMVFAGLQNVVMTDLLVEKI